MSMLHVVVDTVGIFFIALGVSWLSEAAFDWLRRRGSNGKN